jgi:malate synthase
MANTHGLQVDPKLEAFIAGEALPGTGIDADAFWQGFSDIVHDLGPKNAKLLAHRTELQGLIDNWHIQHRGEPHDNRAYKEFLTEIGYLLPEAPDFKIDTANVDAEIATIPGPQLVVPITNARYALNAANARWGSLYDGFYGTDAMRAPVMAMRNAMPWSTAR